jgi:hypothetical protein
MSALRFEVGALVYALGIGGGFSSFECVQFSRGNHELGEPTVQTDQNILANVDGGNIHFLCVGEAGCQLPFKLLHVFGLARSTRHFFPPTHGCPKRTVYPAKCDLVS